MGPDRLAELTEWLQAEAKRQIDGCRRIAQDGVTPIYAPDGAGHYTALWTRDFCYMVEGCPEAIADLDLANAVAALLAGVRDDGTAPDRVQADGLAVYSAGGVHDPVGLPPTDNGAFLVKLVGLSQQRLWHRPVDAPLLAKLDLVLASVPRRSDGLLSIDPAGPPRSPYGFTDCIKKTGGLLFSSLLFWSACGVMAELYAGVDGQAATRWRLESERVAAALDCLWDDSEGVFLAATDDCRQPDVWGSAFAVHLGVCPPERAERVGLWLSRHLEQVAWHGLFRHVREPSGWQATLRGGGALRYQNGGYWPVPAAWVHTALRPVAPDRARSLLVELIEHFQAHGVNEWELPDGTVGARDYVASATLPLLACRAELGEANP